MDHGPLEYCGCRAMKMSKQQVCTWHATSTGMRPSALLALPLLASSSDLFLGHSSKHAHSCSQQQSTGNAAQQV
jgi:hypothetical protein